ncbi:MAG: hypothetical protein K0V04_02930, partial [Deltaproteobacteria bacterium]|nr:hypothetical protein [Deltaproteobacteria bacterium]
MKTAVELLRFSWRALAAQFSQVPPMGPLLKHLHEAAVGSVALLTVLTVFAGLNLSVQSYATFER